MLEYAIKKNQGSFFISQENREHLVNSLLLDNNVNDELGINETKIGSFGATFLIEASKNGMANIVKMLLDNGAKPNAVDDFGKTALIEASKNGMANIVKMLLQAGADINAVDDFGKTALVSAINDKNYEDNSAKDIIKILLDNGAKPNSAILDFALSKIPKNCKAPAEVYYLLKEKNDSTNK